jgi:uncharacterized protein YndB with AHSA1/START domain
MTAAAIVSIRVDATPTEAFRLFVEEIGEWWVENPLFPLTPHGDGVHRFEGGEGGRLVATLASGKDIEIGKVTAFVPGERLAFTWRPATLAPEQATTVDVRFEPAGTKTRITVTHRGWDRVPQEHVARHGFPLAAFQRRLAENWRHLLENCIARRDASAAGD